LLDAAGCGLIGARGLGCAFTPTLVTLFSAQRDAEGVRVLWRLADPTRMAEVWVERADVSSGPWSRVATELSMDGELSVNLDRSALADREYWYRLVGREGTEAVVISQPLSVDGNVARRFELTRVSPNPVSGPLRISFTLAHEAAVEVDVFDVQGRHLASLVRGSQTVGAHVVEWSGLAGTRTVTSGLQLVRYRYPGGQQVLRFVRVR
jgi:hypothetical protein